MPAWRTVFSEIDYIKMYIFTIMFRTPDKKNDNPMEFFVHSAAILHVFLKLLP